MSSEWWSILAVFWGLYLADGLRGGRRDRLFFFSWFARSTLRSRVAQTTWFLIPPTPGGVTLIAEDLPASLSPEGLTNWPSGSASRPPPLPQDIAVFRWETIQKIEERSGWLHINGHRFAPATASLNAAALRELANELAPLSPTARADRLSLWHERRFHTARLRRRVRSALLRSRGLAFLNTIQVVFAAAISAYLMLDGPNHVSPRLRDALAAALPQFLIAYGLLHLAALTLFFTLHLRLYPSAGQERASTIFTALFVPPQGLRLRLHLTAKLGADQHPLAVAMVCARPDTAHALAVDTVRDLRWPLLAQNLPSSISQQVRASAALLEPVVFAALARQSAPIPLEELLAAPVRESSETCAYCPRCGDQFTRLDARCAHGVALVPFPRIDSDRRS